MDDKRTITVKGVGTASTKPDYVIINFKLTAKDKDYGRSVEEANRRIGLLKNAVESVRFSVEDLKTISYNVRTDYENVRNKFGSYDRKFVGYCCEYQLRLSFYFDSNRLSEVMNSISESNSDVEISVSFTVKNPAKVSRELLKSAAEDAREKADILSSALGAKLGALLLIDYNWGEMNIISRSTYEMNDMMRGVDAVPLAAAPVFEPENINSKDSATFVWELN